MDRQLGAAIGYRLVDQLELELLVELVEQQPVGRPESAAIGLGEGQRDHVPTAAGQVGLVGPGAGQQGEGAEIRVAGLRRLEVSALALESFDVRFADHVLPLGSSDSPEQVTAIPT